MGEIQLDWTPYADGGRSLCGSCYTYFCLLRKQECLRTSKIPPLYYACGSISARICLIKTQCKLPIGDCSGLVMAGPPSIMTGKHKLPSVLKHNA